MSTRAHSSTRQTTPGSLKKMRSSANNWWPSRAKPSCSLNTGRSRKKTWRRWTCWKHKRCNFGNLNIVTAPTTTGMQTKKCIGGKGGAMMAFFSLSVRTVKSDAKTPSRGATRLTSASSDSAYLIFMYSSLLSDWLMLLLLLPKKKSNSVVGSLFRHWLWWWSW